MWQGGEVILLGTMPGGNFSLASAINEQGQIVGRWGNSATGDPALGAFRWVAGVMSSIELPMGPNAVAVDVNQSGAIVGWMGQLIDSRAFIWADGEVTDLGVIPNGFTGKAAAINDVGQVCGEGALVRDGRTVLHSFMWKGERMIDLGTLPGTAFSRAADLNDHGQIVGYCHNAGLTGLTPFIWQDGVMTNLNDLIPPEQNVTVSIAQAINNAGQITADESGTSDTVLLTPIAPPIGDINIDCTVDVDDLIILLSDWAQTDSLADLNGDGVVNVLDLIILLLDFGASSTP